MIVWPEHGLSLIHISSLSTPIIGLIFTEKWFPAQPLLYAYCVTAMFTAVGVPLSELFFAQDDAWFNVRLCLWWAIPTWTFGTYAVYHYGLFGFAIFQTVLQSTWLLAFFHARKPEGLRVFAPLREPLILSAALVLGNLLVIRSMAISSIYRLAVLLAVEGAICAFFLVRMAMSWRTMPGPMEAEANTA